ncbi:synaptotagmin-like protein 2 [Acipenser ruthenus]|uniref:synaptotagmin-like protein 2 n=1 Tax=Acipenser ruthenus TaxID=7906 RepID=UPI00274270EF|nr:synaptotagmin-like protein 2 [Acipenser ruthenus]
MEEMYIKMYFMNASQDVLSTGDANKMQWSPPRRAPPTPAPRSAYATAEDSDLSPNKYGGSLNNEEVVGSPLHVALFPSSTYETFLEENEQNGVDPVEDREPSIDTIDNSEEAVTLSKDDTYKLRGYVKKVITSTCMQMDDDVQERGEAILVEETVVDSASYQSRAFDTHGMGSPVMKALARATTAKVTDSASERMYNSPVIPNEDLEQNDTEEENSTPSTASASEVSVRVDWSVNSVDSSSLDDQPRVQFALDFSQRSQKFQIYISQCKNLDRMEVHRGSVDAYIKTYLLPDKYKMSKRKTTVKKRSTNPVYNEILRYKIEYSPLLTCTLELSVWHSSILGRNACLGDVQVDMSSWDWQDKRLNWYPLNPRSLSNPGTRSLQPSTMQLNTE